MNINVITFRKLYIDHMTLDFLGSGTLFAEIIFWSVHV